MKDSFRANSIRVPYFIKYAHGRLSKILAKGRAGNANKETLRAY